MGAMTDRQAAWTEDQTFTATRAELLDALTHLIAEVPWPSEISRDGTITIDAESMADAIIGALDRGQRHTIHYHWPPQCGHLSVPEGDTWSGNLDLVNCPGCLIPLAESEPEPMMVSRPCGCTSMVTDGQPVQISWCDPHDPGYPSPDTGFGTKRPTEG